MPEIGVTLPIYTMSELIGFIALLVGVILILAGIGIINTPWIKAGKATWIIGIPVVLVGLGLLAFSEPASPKAAATSTPPTNVLSVPIEEISTPDLLLCKDIGDLVGTEVICKVNRTYCSYQADTTGSPTFCNDAPFPNEQFTLVVWGRDWSDYDGKCIIIDGIVTMYRGNPQIEGTSRSQITFCP